MASRMTGEARHMARQAGPGVVALARLGFAARGIVYVLVGALAVRAARGPGDAEGQEGALRTILTQPFGRALLAAVAVGLAGYALWRAVEAIADPEGKGTDAKGIVTRIGYGISAVLHAGLAVEAGRMAMRGAAGSGGDGTAHWTAMVMEQPFGRIAVAVAGAIVAAFGVYQLYRAYAEDPAEQLVIDDLGRTAETWLVRGGRIGTAARGVVFVVSGIFLVRAGLRSDPSEARGLEGALETLHRQPYGPWLLGAVAVGLAAFGVFELAKARYRRISPP